MRKTGTTSRGGSFPEAIINAVWMKGTVVPGQDARQYRKDACGAWMRRDLHGDTSNDMGWEVDHVVPVARGGSDDLSNLQPLQWQNNRHKGDDYPQWSCAVSAK